MTTEEILRAARELIAEPERWTQGTLARYGNNHSADALDVRACRWCAVGAVVKVTGHDDIWYGPHAAAGRLLDECAVCLDDSCVGIVELNDVAGHGAVLAAYDAAIKAASASSRNDQTEDS